MSVNTYTDIRPKKLDFMIAKTIGFQVPSVIRLDNNSIEADIIYNYRKNKVLLKEEYTDTEIMEMSREAVINHWVNDKPDQFQHARVLGFIGNDNTKDIRDISVQPQELN